MTQQIPNHFQGKDALTHVIEAQAQGKVDSAEIHGAEIPGHLYAFADAARETAVITLLFWVILSPISFPLEQNLLLVAIFLIGWILWKSGRSAWLAWSRLERLHRIVAEERWEIEHHRQQERDELRELYAAKGFEGKLLEDVLDVLMADGDRLLRVMVEEELGLSLEVYEHPLKQGLGAALGTLLAGSCALFGWWIAPLYGIIIAAFLVIGISAALSSYYQRNKLTPAIIWNLALAGLAFGIVYFLFQMAAP